MTDKADLDRLEAIIHRRGKPAAPTVEPIVAEVRSQDEIPVRSPDPDPDLDIYASGFFLIEWTFGVPYKEIEGFHKFLRKNERFISNCCDLVTPGRVRYLGTWWAFGVGPSIYRTLWLYDNKNTVAELEQQLQNSPRFFDVMTKLRSYWEMDPGRIEQMYQPASLFDDLTKDASPYSFIRVSVEASK